MPVHLGYAMLDICWTGVVCVVNFSLEDHEPQQLHARTRQREDTGTACTLTLANWQKAHIESDDYEVTCTSTSPSVERLHTCATVVEMS